MSKALFSIALSLFLLVAIPARAMPIFFEATLDGGQEVPPSGSSASGTATLELNAAQDRLEIMIQLFGLDLDGAQTLDPGDDMIAGHIHAAAMGVNGPVVFGFLSPDNDTNGDLLIDAVAGTIFTGWDLNEGNGTTLAAQLPALFSSGLYFNIHTVDHPPGAIRGQILPRDPQVPAPATVLLLSTGLLLFRFSRVRA